LISRGRALKNLSNAPGIDAARGSVAAPQEVDRKAAKVSAFNATKQFLETVFTAATLRHAASGEAGLGVQAAKTKSAGAKA
jgi:hypothetical protein